MIGVCHGCDRYYNMGRQFPRRRLLQTEKKDIII